MSAPIDPAQLRYMLAVRGLSFSDLARRAKVSNATVTAANKGRSISPDSTSRIAAAIGEVPEDEVIKRLLPKVIPPQEGDQPPPEGDQPPPKP